MDCHEVNAKILSDIFVRQIGHSEHANEQGLHTAKSCRLRKITRNLLIKGEYKQGVCNIIGVSSISLRIWLSWSLT